ncbi:MAG: hypothetical protein FWF95_04090 [Syntrophorhabdaceae bacterium]|nr:hypothetical protein [Syntrophorhabdaceae bacterium]
MRLFIVALAMAITISLAGSVWSAECRVKGIRLHGRVKEVNAHPDLKVQVVGAFPDLDVKLVNAFPNSCGEWQMVTASPDFTIQFVTAFPDLKIRYVKAFPGKR